MLLSPYTQRPPVLLCNANFYGTLAAVRCYGRLGIPITVADSTKLAHAQWSKFVSRRERAPLEGDADALLSWLFAFGRQYPGHVLYPTNDEMAWLLAYHQERLAGLYRMYS